MKCVRPAIRLGRRLGSARSVKRSSSGSTLYFAASAQKRSCSSLSFSGFLRREVVGLAEILVDVVELPVVVGEVVADRHSPTAAGRGGRPPSSRRGRARGCRTSRSTAFRAGSCAFGVVEAVDHADALDRLLRTPLTSTGSGTPAASRMRRHDVDDVVELGAHAARRP